jgi:hypothetical protein
VQELEDEYNKAESTLKATKDKTEQAMWLEELENVEKEYIKFRTDYCSKHNDEDADEANNTSTNKRKKNTRK